jgi:carboxymethylenebutenolidase
MGDLIKLKASDGHAFAAYERKPAGPVRGALVVVQEIFGVNPHVRSVADGYAADGYRVLAPALFDRAERDVELSYDGADRDKAIALRKAIAIDAMLLDIAASISALESTGKIGIVGYCLGGSLTWLAATRLSGLAAAIGYYGSMIAANLAETPRCPVLLHFGEEDGGISMADVEKIRASVDPGTVQIFTYPGAGHAFNRAGNAAYHEPSAKLARERTLAFLRQHVG